MKLINDLSEQRITPACAGNRKIFLLIKCSVKDHPACAGNSLMPKAKNYKSKDHPRLRGEQNNRGI